MTGRLPIIAVAATGIGRAMRSLPGLLGIYWLPWLLGTIVLLILEVVVQDQLRIGWAPGWARSIAWAPFGAMVSLTLLRWVLNGEAPTRPINLDAGRQTWVAAPIVALWGAADATDAFIPMLMGPVITSDTPLLRWEDIEPYLFAFPIAAWLINSAILAGFFGLVVVVARGGNLNLRKHWRLLRLQPLRLFCVCLVGHSGRRRPAQCRLARPGVARRRPARTGHAHPVAGAYSSGIRRRASAFSAALSRIRDPGLDPGRGLSAAPGAAGRAVTGGTTLIRRRVTDWRWPHAKTCIDCGNDG